MENALKALVIAGGVLLGVLTITIVIYTFSSASTVSNAQKHQEEMKRLNAWNAEWEAYNRTLLYGSQVLTVCNKAEQNNLEAQNNQYNVQVIVYKNGSKITKDIFINSADERKAIYKCKEMHYNQTTGRIDKIVFENVI